MDKDTKYIGQPILLQLIKLLSKSTIDEISKKHNTNYCVKRFNGYDHLVTLLYSVFSGCDSLREIVVGMLSNAGKFTHLGLHEYIVKRSTLSDANKRRSSDFFADIYYSLLTKYRKDISDSRTSTIPHHNLYIIDSTTITLFKQVLKGAGRNPLTGKKKGGIKVHTLMKSEENVPQLAVITSAATHDHIILKQLSLPEHSFVVFDRAYVDYAQYEVFTQNKITYVTKQKKNAKSEYIDDIEIPDSADAGIIKDAIVIVKYGQNKCNEHKMRLVAYWNSIKRKTYIYLSNNFELSAEDIIDIYARRWQIETLFKQLKQNFPLKYFLGDNENAIKSQIWVTLIANLLVYIIKKRIKRPCSFTGTVSLIRIQLMCYISLIDLLERPERAWLDILKKKKEEERKKDLFSH